MHSVSILKKWQKETADTYPVNLTPDDRERQTGKRTGKVEKGEMPGMVAVDSQIVTATVEEINLEANTFKLKGPDGTINEFTARDPENLKRAAVGDLVVITTTEAVAISVEEGAAE